MTASSIQRTTPRCRGNVGQRKSRSDATRLAIILFNKQHVYCGKSHRGYGFTYFAKEPLLQGEVVFKVIGKLIDHQTSRCSIQIDVAQHFLPSIWTGRYLNHSCDPNTYVRTAENGFPDLIASRDIHNQEEITYAYWCTEYCWTRTADEQRVRCKCGSDSCRRRILAFSQLSAREQQDLVQSRRCSRYLWK